MSLRFDAVLGFTAAFALGILVASWTTPSLALGVFVLSVVLVFLGLYAYFKTPLVFALCIVVLGGAFGGIRMELSEIQNLDQALEVHIEERVLLEGVVVGEPDLRERTTLLTVELKRLRDVEVFGKMLVSVDPYMEVAYGDRIRFEGVLEKPENFETDSGNIFNYVAYLDKDDIHYRMWNPEIVVLSEGEGNPLVALLLRVKQVSLNQLSRIFPEPEVSLLAGLLLGVKQSLGEELLDAFRVTGLIHVVVLSGYNLTLVADAVRWVTTQFIRRSVISAIVAGSAIVLFSIMAGASATVVRATAMALLVLVARESGRVYEVIRALFVTGLLMLIWNPKLLLYDPGFQLSFLATVGLIVAAPRFESYLTFVTKKLQLRSIVAATLGTQLLVLPLLLYQTGMISIIGVFANLLVLPLIPATMLLGFVAGTLSFLHPWVASPFTALTHALLSYELFVAEFFSALPFSAVSIQDFPWWGMVALYVLGVGLYMWISRREFGMVSLPHVGK